MNPTTLRAPGWILRPGLLGLVLSAAVLAACGESTSPSAPPDTEAPTVAITDPAPGPVAGTVSIIASASDNVGIKHVKFYVNGVLIATDDTAPYVYEWDTSLFAAGFYTWMATAVDGRGNFTESDPVDYVIP